jgi:hypothetical protein
LTVACVCSGVFACAGLNVSQTIAKRKKIASKQNMRWRFHKNRFASGFRLFRENREARMGKVPSCHARLARTLLVPAAFQNMAYKAIQNLETFLFRKTM